ncbi:MULTISPECIES: phosphoenolpyruvate--protein phosphotransferase [Mycobacteriaceae]|uniref:Phosphoenolpyruvate-protein phosphotransferase n=1 Tax=Mycolicibacterium neoaurum VKM Ac-1815D TaxID=700508 RepID=V5X6F9_MYCNE|nr:MULTISPECIES: putative PEP-binding protein [Mycobacteriaceae]AHC23408.1 phosphoenolpyruvate-protein phosphotransferase [Mycolicibacterium neoaurum VKM Ac-1815D]AMO04125.1 phosphoenolpyruvate-protein phosphotransferase [Mycolicibacterium neoaurum]AXK77604.1 phosphoenolpyruvate--protein phosphotransferase [Mycolicibacterium neoaurum]KJQ49913.1 phosphoenolpyruvate-protein phosphotransferase [Mycolicibacterium neoaurum]KUM08605.1 phosphoenolpyruvate--protein phosphotransferase [Mycolicibacteriu
MCGFTLASVDLSMLSCNLNHMSSPTVTDPKVLHGVPVVAGVAYAPVIRPGARPQVTEQSAAELAEADRPAEVGRLKEAAATVATRLRDRAGHATGVASEVLATTAALAQDRAWLGDAEKRINAGNPAPQAVGAAIAKIADALSKAGDLMAERVTDLRDIRDRVLAQLAGLPEPGVPIPDNPSVLCAEDLAPADTAGLDPRLVVALVTTLGGPTSHTAIIARQLGIPCVVAVDGLDEVPVGVPVMVDGALGTVTVAPDAAEAERAVETSRVEADRVAQWKGPGATSDGHSVAVLANVQDGAAAQAARQTPAEGVGLFRTELCFLNRDTEPSVDEQARIYGEVLSAFEGRKVVIRTLDAGSDKPLKFAGHPDEANPALGVRGVRISFGNPGLMTRQLESIAAAAAATGSDPWVMAPMIATADEAKTFADQARSFGLTPGVMIEIPAAALLAGRILEHVDFLSIGTNDLAQYTMAADRMSAELATLTDPWQPGVLALVDMTARAGAAAGKPVGVCGEAAADPMLACVLVGMGITSLSAAATAVPGVGAALSGVTLEQCRAAAEAVLSTASAADARAAAFEVLG